MLAREACQLLALLLVAGQLCSRSASLLLRPTSKNQFANARGARFELKFQNELDKSTIIKRETQLQTFKCQVRLAPFTNQLSAPRARFKSTVKPVNIAEQNERTTLLNSSLQEAQFGWPTNVTLSIDWFRGDQQLAEGGSEPVSVVNVELKSNGSSAKNGAAADRGKSKARLEIKNTLNGGQLKLTSRLKLSQLKATDSGQYRCVARAQFQVVGDQSGPVQQSNNKQAISDAQPDGQKLWSVQQTLESNVAILLVTNSSTAGK